MPPMALTDTPPALDDVESAVYSLMSTMEPSVLAADRCINPDRWVLSPRYETADMTIFARSEAVEWFDANAETVLGCIQIAHGTARFETAWTLAKELWSYLHIRKNWNLWRTVYEAVRARGP